MEKFFIHAQFGYVEAFVDNDGQVVCNVDHILDILDVGGKKVFDIAYFEDSSTVSVQETDGNGQYNGVVSLYVPAEPIIMYAALNTNIDFDEFVEWIRFCEYDLRGERNEASTDEDVMDFHYINNGLDKILKFLLKNGKVTEENWMAKLNASLSE